MCLKQYEEGQESGQRNTGIYIHKGLPWWLSGKESSCDAIEVLAKDMMVIILLYI